MRQKPLLPLMARMSEHRPVHATRPSAVKLRVVPSDAFSAGAHCLPGTPGPATISSSRCSWAIARRRSLLNGSAVPGSLPRTWRVIHSRQPGATPRVTDPRSDGSPHTWPSSPTISIRLPPPSWHRRHCRVRAAWQCADGPAPLVVSTADRSDQKHVACGTPARTRLERYIEVIRDGHG